MYLLIGLGNPGEEYAKTRHNAGFMFVDYIAEKNNLTFEYDKYFKAEIARMKIESEEIILAKPQTFMNRSGETVKQIVIRHSLTPDHVYVAHDDLDIKLGEYKISMGKGPKLHNGIRSIEEIWKTQDFWRIRLGIENRQGKKIDGVNYVLQNFESIEKSELTSLFIQLIKLDTLPFSFAL
jgi:PTH1 family peptidyl-tRNA hydrolase